MSYKYLLPSLALFVLSCDSRPADKIVLPKDYIGEVRVYYKVPNRPPLSQEKGRLVFRIPPSGILETSSPYTPGWASDRYYYFDAASRTEMEVHVNSATSLVKTWDQGVATRFDEGRNTQVTYWHFFIGTKEDYERHRRQRLKEYRDNQ